MVGQSIYDAGAKGPRSAVGSVTFTQWPSLAVWHPGIVPGRVLRGTRVSAALAVQFGERPRDGRLLVYFEPCNKLLPIIFRVKGKGYSHDRKFLELIRTLFGKISILAWVALDIEEAWQPIWMAIVLRRMRWVRSALERVAIFVRLSVARVPHISSAMPQRALQRPARFRLADI